MSSAIENAPNRVNDLIERSTKTSAMYDAASPVAINRNGKNLSAQTPVSALASAEKARLLQGYEDTLDTTILEQNPHLNYKTRGDDITNAGKLEIKTAFHFIKEDLVQQAAKSANIEYFPPAQRAV